jgi:hypothetical protein
MIGRHRTIAAGIFFGMLLLSPFALLTTASADSHSSGTYGASFLRVPIGARVMAVPDVVAGMRPDASMAFSNPSLTADLTSRQVFFSTATWLEDLNLSAASAVIPVERFNLNWSMGTRLLYSGGLQGYDASGTVVEEKTFYDLAVSSGVSKRFDEIGLAVGVGATYLREQQPAQVGSGVVFTVGASYQYREHRVDVLAKDFGGEMKFDSQSYPIDSRVIVGYARNFQRAWGALDVGAQLTASKSDYKRLDVGGAYHINQYFTLRSGVHRTFNGPATSEVPITGGLGVNYSAFALDYAYTSQEFFPATHTFAVTYSFGEGMNTPPPGTYGSTGLPAPAKTVTTPVKTVKASAQSKDKKHAVSYLVIGGVHNRLESARAEVRALRLLNVPAVAEKTGGNFRVLVGRYNSLDDANRAANSFLKKGHRFEVIHEES